jgi:hypothetical protein
MKIGCFDIRYIGWTPEWWINYRIKRFIKCGRKIQAIGYLRRKKPDWYLAEAKDRVDRIEKFRM